MSLVERTAQRLEELRRSGQQVGGDLVYAKEDGPSKLKATKPSTVERIADELAKRSEAQPLPSLEPLLSDTLVSGIDTEEISHDRNRLEPKLQPAVSSPTSDVNRKSRSRSVSVDLARLAANGLLTPEAVASPLANELRVIKRPLINNALGKSAGSVKHASRIMVTSSVSGEGKSFVSTNLAMSIAMERNSTVLLVEADPTRPTLSGLLGLSAGQGLMDLLLQPSIDVADVLVKLDVGRLTFLPSGTRHGHATELLASAAMEKLVEHLASRYADRVLIFDAPPLLAAPEARVLARYMGQIVFVVEAGKTTHSVAQQALATIESCPVILPVLNKASAREERMYYYSG